MAQHRLYAIFWERDGRPHWNMYRNGRSARQLGHKLGALVLSMPLPSGGGAWDAPTFRAVADRVEYNPEVSREQV